jgi:hypothetical protein
LCRASALTAYLSTGLITGTFGFVGCRGRGASYIRVSEQQQHGIDRVLLSCLEGLAGWAFEAAKRMRKTEQHWRSRQLARQQWPIGQQSAGVPLSSSIEKRQRCGQGRNRVGMEQDPATLDVVVDGALCLRAACGGAGRRQATRCLGALHGSLAALQPDDPGGNTPGTGRAQQVTSSKSSLRRARSSFSASRKFYPLLLQLHHSPVAIIALSPSYHLH